MNDIKFTAAFGDVDKKVSLSQPNGGGGGYHIVIDNLYCGQITKIKGQWVAHLNDKSLPDFTSDDIGVIGDIIDGLQPLL